MVSPLATRRSPPRRAVPALGVALAVVALAAPACSRSDASTFGLASLTGAGAPGAAAPAPAVDVAPPAPAPAPSDAPPACPDGMLLVEGQACDDVEHTCLRWLDPPTSRYAHFRCAEYGPARCRGSRRRLRFCIDRGERAPAPGALPENHQSFRSARALCAASGARLCKESEWVFACEGEEMRPYPYGFRRDSAACNVDRTEGLGRSGRLVDHRARPDDHPGCASPFGVLDLAGNLEEWVEADAPKAGYRNVMKGSWWIPSRHACRQYQIGHDTAYEGTETGARCCRDADLRPSPCA